MKTLLALVLVAACNVDNAPQTLTDLCGPPPAFPKFATAVERYEDGHLMVVITTQTYGEIVRYKQDVASWQECAAEVTTP